MDKISKINIKLIEYQKELGNSRLEFNLAGSNIDYIVANTIRRTILTDIPIYAFNEFKFEKNTSIFHNNYLKLRFRQMPVWDIDNKLDFIEIAKEETNNINDSGDILPELNPEDEVELETENIINSSTLKQMTMYVNYKNKTNNIYTVTTDDAKFYYEQKLIKSPYKIAIPLVKLQEGQEIVFSAITNIGTENMNAMYGAVCIVGYKQNDTSVECHDVNFFLESRGQITEKRILNVAIINIERKLNNFLKMIKETVEKNINKDSLEGIIVVNNEDHTLGNLISRGMQQHKKISFAGYNMPHPLANTFHLHYKLTDNKENVKDIIEDVVNYYIELFDDIKKGINSMKV
jgi:DNA-directed RNA polymerase subunit L